MSIICPTVTPTSADPHEYREQLERILPLSPRIQLDFMDGIFTDSRSLNVIHAWWPEDKTVDIHLMYEDPVSQIETLVSMKPNMVIIHAEAIGDLLRMVEHLKKFSIRTGVALLQDTTPQVAHALIGVVDHVLLFSGRLGHFGGVVDFDVLKKIPEIKKINPKVEIGWDGGANENNVRKLMEGGVDVINVGSAIQQAEDPKVAYAKLLEVIS